MAITQDVIELLDVVALTVNVPEKGLCRGQVGTVVENLAAGVFEVEFSDEEGRMYAQAALKVTVYRPARILGGARFSGSG